MSDELKAWVMQAAARPEVAEAVETLYAQLQARIDQRKPLCVMSGRCCRFDEYGHRLFVTTLELGAFVRRLEGQPGTFMPQQGGCPFQVGKMCGVHAIRPFGCRVFFCDSTATQWQQEQYEHFHEELKHLHEEMGVKYAYIEWRAALSCLGLGEFSDPSRK